MSRQWSIPKCDCSKAKCVENFQKRVGAWLRNIKSENKGKLTDGKPLSGKDCLTEKVINNL